MLSYNKSVKQRVGTFVSSSAEQRAQHKVLALNYFTSRTSLRKIAIMVISPHFTAAVIIRSATLNGRDDTREMLLLKTARNIYRNSR